MKLTSLLLLMLIASGMAWGQTQGDLSPRSGGENGGGVSIPMRGDWTIICIGFTASWCDESYQTQAQASEQTECHRHCIFEGNLVPILMGDKPEPKDLYAEWYGPIKKGWTEDLAAYKRHTIPRRMWSFFADSIEPLPLGPRPVERIEVEPEKCFGCWQGGVGGMPVSDVPAIQVDLQVKALSEDGGYLKGFSEACEDWRNGKMTWKPQVIACHWKGYTCADKSRVLLTSEDGKRHCIKF